MNTKKKSKSSSKPKRRPKPFDSRCEGCHTKKAAGLRTGDEPPPTRRAGEKWVDHDVLRAKRAAASRARKAMLTPRVPTC